MPQATTPPIDIVYADDDFIVVNKPSGLLSVPGLSDPDNLHDRVLQHYPNARTVHRLDMPTSGLVIFALHHECQKRFGRMFELKQFNKQYIAEISGCINHDCGEIQSPLICDWERRPIQKIDWLKGKSSHTTYSVIQRSTEKTRVLLKPITGRTHQLRLHMYQIGHPILGDNFYNINGSDKRASRLLLHATQLRFAHPITEQSVHIECTPDF